MKIFTERGYSFASAAERESVRDVKEQLFWYDNKMKSTAESSDTEKTYKLPDGNIIIVGAERFRRPDALFHIRKEFLCHRKSRHSSFFLVLGSFFLCCCFLLFISCFQDLHANVVLLLGTTMCQGNGERMTNELTALAPSTLKIKVVVPQEQNIQCGSVHFVSVGRVFCRSWCSIVTMYVVPSGSGILFVCCLHTDTHLDGGGFHDRADETDLTS